MPPDENLPGRPFHFADRVEAQVRERGSCLVVGLDPVLERLPGDVIAAAGGGIRGPGWTARAAAAVGLFCEGVLEAAGESAAAVKPNTAYFERFGAAGWDCLRRVCEAAQRRGLLVIADAKRADVRHTAEAYAEALLGDEPDTLGPYVDALTVNPYLGTDGVEPFVEAAAARGKGIYVLVRTSNPSAAEIQDLEAGERRVFEHVAELVARWGEALVGKEGLSAVGAVVGATAPEEAEALRRRLPAAPFLLPGFGAQGGGEDDVRRTFAPGGKGVLVNASRSILYAYEKSGEPWRDALRKAAEAARERLEAVRKMA